MYRRSFSRIVTRKKGLRDPGDEHVRGEAIRKGKRKLREKDELTVSVS